MGGDRKLGDVGHIGHTREKVGGDEITTRAQVGSPASKPNGDIKGNWNRNSEKEGEKFISMFQWMEIRGFKLGGKYKRSITK